MNRAFLPSKDNNKSKKTIKMNDNFVKPKSELRASYKYSIFQYR